MSTRSRYPGSPPPTPPRVSPPHTLPRTFVEEDAGDPECGEEQRKVLAAVYPAWGGLGERVARLGRHPNPPGPAALTGLGRRARTREGQR